MNFIESFEGMCCDVCDYYRSKDNLEAIQATFGIKVKKLYDRFYIYMVKSSIGEITLFRRLKEQFKYKLFSNKYKIWMY